MLDWFIVISHCGTDSSKMSNHTGRNCGMIDRCRAKFYRCQSCLATVDHFMHNWSKWYQIDYHNCTAMDRWINRMSSFTVCRTHTGRQERQPPDPTGGNRRKPLPPFGAATADAQVGKIWRTSQERMSIEMKYVNKMNESNTWPLLREVHELRIW